MFVQDWIVCDYGNWLNKLCKTVVLTSESGAWCPWGKQSERENRFKVMKSQTSWHPTVWIGTLCQFSLYTIVMKYVPAREAGIFIME